ncbi:MAG: nicotinate-nucleotide adenylyltransferase [Pleurocapsa sp. SU_5_0]|nr:nicotinate-nucleotide adenylyltransferase [Pleurocapsa sp. SU_5_0]NJO98016.1 nicotinate-nucleotide adenylyltransferase [Pleurocapsa sp. CRU_1_2]NJR45591.1 nicotinate-nucleotide adenylyltransferase [Hyellaceae cyanobacterium CSU_1_1]
MKKIALFGTSADPPTIGHQTILHWLSQHYDRVVVWASDNPFKQDQTPLQYRSQMLQLAISDLKLKNTSVHPELSDRYTLITVNKARKKWGQNIELSLVIGSDILPQIHSWYCIKELLAQVKMLIVPRVGYGIETADLASLNCLGGEYAIASLNVSQVSSSAYRVQKDQSLVTPSVKDYIERWNLYQIN